MTDEDFNLSKERKNIGIDSARPYWIYPEDKLKEAVRRLKEKIENLVISFSWEEKPNLQQRQELYEKIDKIFGEKLC